MQSHWQLPFFDAEHAELADAFGPERRLRIAGAPPCALQCLGRGERQCAGFQGIHGLDACGLSR